MNVTLLEPAEHRLSWWNGSATGDEICARLGQPPCTSMVGPLQGYLRGEGGSPAAFGCKRLSCSSAVECSSAPEPCGAQLEPERWPLQLGADLR